VASKHTAIAWCLEIHDLVLSKCAAGRERDWMYAREAMHAELVNAETLFARIGDLPITAQEQEHVERMLRAVRACATS
jgi:ferric-dicitrate binding protein FerR (iron transport regulator)